MPDLSRGVPMSVSSIASSSAAFTAAIRQQSAPTAVQPIGREKENDGDKDDGTTAVKAPSPSVNLNGQTVGGTINVTA
jgi:hypothetical protein